MRYSKNQSGRKLASWLLASLLCFSVPAGALAAEGESSLSEEPEQVVSSVPFEESSQLAEPLPEPSMSPAPSAAPSPAPLESAVEGEVLKENEEQSFASDSLLVTGGHKTYMNGYAGALFLPESIMTRAEASQMLYNLLAAKPPVAESRFSDVSLSQWYGTAVNALAKSGVLSGYTDGTFLPNNTITRAEFVTALTRCFSLNEGTASFTDVPETHWAYKYIAAATSMGWISGMGNGLFQPDRGIRRCEAVTVMNLALGRTGDGFAADRETPKFRDVPKSHWAYLQIAEAAEPVESVSPSPSPSTDPGSFTVGQTIRVTASGLNLRSQASTDSSVVTVLSRGTLLTVTSVDMPWLGVKTSNGTAGFVHSGSGDGWYVEAYTPGTVSGVSLSASKLSFHQYQTARLDASLSSGSLFDMNWSSSDPSVAEVGYTVGYGSGRTEHGAMIYGKKPGTATLTISDAGGKTKASCTVTVTAPEGVRYGYASENTAVKGKNFDLVAVTDPSRTSVTFKIVDGPAPGSFTTTTYTTESRQSQYGLPTNTVRVFKRTVAFQAAGLYTVRASSGNSSDYQEFEVLVKAADESATATAYGERRTSTKGLDMIAKFEGSVPEIADDSIAAGNPTVGYGFVVQQNQAFYNNMTPAELRGKLVDAVNNGGYSSAVSRFCTNNNLKISQAQFDVLVSFVYNLGPGNLSTQYDTFKVILNAVVPPSDLSESRPYTGTLNTTGSSIYAETSLSSRAIVSVPAGKTVSVIGYKAVTDKKQVWYKVKYGANTGWMPAGRVRLSATGLTRDMAYVDSTAFANNYLQWHKSGNTCIPGLLNRRLAECKVFTYGRYEDAVNDWGKNTYGFDFPDNCGCKQYENQK